MYSENIVRLRLRSLAIETAGIGNNVPHDVAESIISRFSPDVVSQIHMFPDSSSEQQQLIILLLERAYYESTSSFMVTKSVPTFFACLPNSGFSLEEQLKFAESLKESVKRRKEGILSTEQQEIIEAINRRGIAVGLFTEADTPTRRTKSLSSR